MRKFEGKVCDVEQEREGRELMCLDVRVCVKSHNRSIIYFMSVSTPLLMYMAHWKLTQRLIQVLQEVAAPHQRYDHEVNLPKQLLLVHLRNIIVFALAPKEFECLVAIFHGMYGELAFLYRSNILLMRRTIVGGGLSDLWIQSCGHYVDGAGSCGSAVEVMNN